MPTSRPIFLPGHEPLRRLERLGLIALLFLVIAFGMLVIWRSAFSQSRRTDATCYFTAGWAVRTGQNIYEVSTDRGWFWVYPPVAALCFVPFADAPPGTSREWLLPYSVSISLWVVLCLGAMFLAVDWFARGLEEHAGDPALRRPPTGSRRWWTNRLLPQLICLAPIGCTYSRGQITPILLLCCAGCYLCWMRGRRFCSGLWLSAAICLKIIPALLVVCPLWRRDWRALAGIAVGLFAGVAVVPSLVWGIGGAVRVHREMIDHVLLPGLGAEGQAACAKEMLTITATDNQSIQATLHNYLHWEQSTRPPKADTVSKVGHVLLGTLLVAVSLLVLGRDRGPDPVGDLLLFGGLLLLLAILSPVSHTHYFCLAVPLIMALTQRSLEADSARLLPSARMLALLGLAGFCYAIVMVPIWERRREVGLPLFASLLLWGTALVQRQARSVAQSRESGSHFSDRQGRPQPGQAPRQEAAA
jgi:alpha-1,2-mannosyltransferase